jgi:putative ABC transport system permease protein
VSVLSLAVRNLLRNRRRSLATLLAVAIGATAVLLFGGYRHDIKYNMQSNHVRVNGHLQVQHRDFFDYGSGNPTAYGIQDFKAVVDAVQSDPELARMVAVTTTTLQFGAIAGNYAAGVSRTVIAVGIRAEDVDRMRAWNPYGLVLSPPRLALLGAPPDAAVVGHGVARVLQICEPLGLQGCRRLEGEADAQPKGKAMPTDLAALSALESDAGKPRAGASDRPKIELLSSSPSGTPNVAQLQLIAAENQGVKELDDITVALHLDQAQRLVFGRSAPRVTAIVLQLKRTEYLAAAKKRLDELLASTTTRQPLVTIDFEQSNPFYVQAVRLFDTIFGFIFVLIGGIVLFTVDNTMNTAVVERTVEIGTLRSMGLRRRGIQVLFVTEGLLLGVAGALAGVVAALLLSALINHSGLTWQPPGYAFAVPLIVRVWGEVAMMVGTTVGLIAITALSAWMPARRASRLAVVEALRHA